MKEPGSSLPRKPSKTPPVQFASHSGHRVKNKRIFKGSSNGFLQSLPKPLIRGSLPLLKISRASSLLPKLTKRELPDLTLDVAVSDVGKRTFFKPDCPILLSVEGLRGIRGQPLLWSPTCLQA